MMEDLFQEGSVVYPLDYRGDLEFSDISYIETYKAVEEFVDAGTVKSIGLCNFNIDQIQEVLKNCKIKPVVNRIEVHPYLTNDNLIKFCQNNNILVVAYAPLAHPDMLL